MADKALMVVGQRRFVQTMRKAGADMDDLKEVNREAAEIALPAVRNLAPRGRTGRLAGSPRVGATKRAGVIRARRMAHVELSYVDDLVALAALRDAVRDLNTAIVLEEATRS